VVLGIRPHDVRLPDEPVEDPAGEIEVDVDVLEALGTESFAHCRVGDVEFTARLPGSVRPAAKERIVLKVPRSHVHLFDAKTGRAFWSTEPGGDD
jgi:ABC-type sugar transport system ATPase subunit